MKNNLFYIVMSLLTLTIGFQSCTKEGPAGPTGQTGATGSAITLVQDGYIKGTITGTKTDSTALSYTFDNKYYFEPGYYKYDKITKKYTFVILRYKSSTFTSEDDRVSLSFTTDSLTATNPTISYIYGYYYQDLGNYKVLNFTYSISNYNISTVTFSAFSFNSTTRVVTGSYVINLDANENSTKNSATVQGSFQATLKEYVN